MTPSFEHFSQELTRLTDIFGKNLAHYKGNQYDEASLRQEFLDPLFRALGWDTENKAGAIPSHREVEIESRTTIGGRQKRADYLFRTDRVDRFVCEAKKPAEELRRYAFQTKRYAWNKNVYLGVLSDFEEIHLFIVGSKPRIDEPEVGLWKTWHFQHYPQAARELWDLLSREAIAGGSIDKVIEALPRKAPTKGKARQAWLIKPDRSRALDTEFLNFLDEARRELAQDLLKNNDRTDLLEDNRLNEAVQRILDRLLFLRICEDRDIDTGIPLAMILRSWRERSANPTPRRVREAGLWAHDDGGGFIATDPRPPAWPLWNDVAAHFKALDRRPPSHIPFFNGNLFKEHFSETLKVGDDWLAGFLDDVSDEESPYLFNVIPVEILGTIYERFLGKIVRPHGKGAVIEEKPEVRKAGGVYYTPRYIVDYIVEQTVGNLLADKSPEKSLDLKVLDPACGSGSFLIRAFERMCEHWQKDLTDHPAKRRRQLCWVDEHTGDVHLTTDLKRRILTANIYGVDLDSGAVEVTQLSLYLKMLENENRQTLAAERDLFGSDIALLPALQDNIKCGNSLIASDFSLDPDDLIRVRAFDWNVGFAKIMKDGGFDAVIGNPPYIRIQGFPEDQIAYFSDKYHSATGNYDIYVNFAERGLHLLSKRGQFGMILPNKFLRTDYGLGLRKTLHELDALEAIVDFGSDQVFEATTYTCLLFLGRSKHETISFASSKAERAALESCVFTQRSVANLGCGAWTFSDELQSRLIEKLKARSCRLLDLPADMSRGSSSGDDEVFVVDAQSHGLEKDVLRTPLFAGDFGRYQYRPENKWQIIFPYIAEEDGFRLLKLEELRRKYPRAFDYLHQNMSRLKVRKQFKEWFGYSAPRNLELHDRAQIAIPLLADQGLFTLIPQHTRGTLCPMASGGFTLTLGTACLLKPEFLLGILNSKLSFWFLRQTSNVFRGGWITCTKQYFGELPIVHIDLSNPTDRARHDKLVGLVDKMLTLTPKLRGAKAEKDRVVLQNAVEATDRQIDALVYELYGLTPEEIALVEGERK